MLFSRGLLLLMLQILSCSGMAYENPLSITENTKLARELRKPVLSYPLSSELGKASLTNDKDSKSFKKSKVPFKTDPIKGIRGKYDEEKRDKEMAFALASELIAIKYQRENGKQFSLGGINSWRYYPNYGIIRQRINQHQLNVALMKQTIQIANQILECRVEMLTPLIKKCEKKPNNTVTSFIKQQTQTGNEIVSCSVTSNSSVNCPPCSTSSNNVNLNSPNYPNDYGGPWKCEYILIAAPGKKFEVIFNASFIVERFYDFLSICDGENPSCNVPARNISGYTSPTKLVTKSNKISIKFVADDSNDALPDGETGRWQLVATSKILSPLSTTTTSTISTTTTQTTTTTTATTTTTETTTSTGTTSTSSPSVASCTPQSGCGNCLNVSSSGGTIHSPNFPNDYQDNLNCTIIIEVSPGAKILLTFTEFNVEQDYDFIMVLGSDKILRGNLTGYINPEPFNIKSNKAIINFQTDENNMGLPYNGSMNTGHWALDFTVIYPIAATIQDSSALISSTTEYSTSTFVPESLGYTCTAECGVCTDLTPNGGVIRSPNYPADYGNNLNCKIIISSAPTRSIIYLDFEVFNVEQDYDFVSVYDGNQKQFSKISGYLLPETTVLKSEQLILEFNTDSDNFGIFSNLRGKWQANFTIAKEHNSATTPVPAVVTTSTLIKRFRNFRRFKG